MFIFIARLNNQNPTKELKIIESSARKKKLPAFSSRLSTVDEYNKI